MDDEFGRDPEGCEAVVLYPENGGDFAWILPEEVATMLGCDMETLHAKVQAGEFPSPRQIGDTCQVGWLSLMH